jgi:hypothetical protein
MKYPVNVSQLTETMEEASITKWYKAVGDQVRKREALLLCAQFPTSHRRDDGWVSRNTLFVVAPAVQPQEPRTQFS